MARIRWRIVSVSTHISMLRDSSVPQRPTPRNVSFYFLPDNIIPSIEIVPLWWGGIGWIVGWYSEAAMARGKNVVSI